MSPPEVPALADLVSLTGKAAVVAGGAGGMGRRIAARLAEAGADVTVADLEGSPVTITAAEIASRFPGRCRAAHVDISDPAGVERLAASVSAANHGKLDIWVNAAAIFGTHELREISDAVWSRMLAVNLHGSFHCARAAARNMDPERGGVIVLVTSLAAHRGRAGRAHYGAAKHGTDGLTKCLAVELGGRGIRVISVAPSVTETPALDLQTQYGDVDPDAHRRVLERAAGEIPLGRIGQPDDIARAVLFAVSDLASFVTGSTLHVDGGASAA